MSILLTIACIFLIIYFALILILVLCVGIKMIIEFSNIRFTTKKQRQQEEKEFEGMCERNKGKIIRLRDAVGKFSIRK